MYLQNHLFIDMIYTYKSEHTQNVVGKRKTKSGKSSSLPVSYSEKLPCDTLKLKKQKQNKTNQWLPKAKHGKETILYDDGNCSFFFLSCSYSSVCKMLSSLQLNVDQGPRLARVGREGKGKMDVEGGEREGSNFESNCC